MSDRYHAPRRQRNPPQKPHSHPEELTPEMELYAAIIRRAWLDLHSKDSIIAAAALEFFAGGNYPDFVDKDYFNPDWIFRRVINETYRQK